MDVNPPNSGGSASDGDALNLSPRLSSGEGPAGDAPTRLRRSGGARRWAGVAVLVLVVAAGAAVVARSLDDATLYFRNADEAVAQQADLVDARFRLQGLVEPGSVEAYPGGVSFKVAYNGVVVDVEHTGDPAELFDDGIPVVLEGRWSGAGAGAVFVSDRMLVKHDENYVDANKVRLDDASDGAGTAAPS
jgi:cytochrome c-type biogenesis protein CcmE